MKQTKNARRTAMKVGAGLVAASAAAAATYYFYGSKNAKHHRKVASAWAADMKKEVVREIKRLENASPKAIAAIVDRVGETYQAARNVDAKDMKRAANELKANWEMLKRETKRTARKSAPRKRATKRTK